MQPGLTISGLLLKAALQLRQAQTSKPPAIGVVWLKFQAVQARERVYIGRPGQMLPGKSMPGQFMHRAVSHAWIMSVNGCGHCSGHCSRWRKLRLLRRGVFRFGVIFPCGASSCRPHKSFRVSVVPLPYGGGDSLGKKRHFNFLGQRRGQPPRPADNFRRAAPNNDGGRKFVARTTSLGTFHALVVAPRPDNPEYPFHVSGCHRLPFLQQRALKPCASRSAETGPENRACAL